MPTLADRNLGIDAEQRASTASSTPASASGALIGALSIGTVFAGRSMSRIVRVGLVAFAGFLAVFSLLRQPGARPTR